MRQARAAVCHAFGEPLSIEGIELDDPHAGEVLVRLAATSICGSDVHIIKGEWTWSATLPLVAGHESAGVVEAVGSAVPNVSQGDRVVLSLLRSCGICRACREGLPWICTGSFDQDAPGRVRLAAGGPVTRGLGTGGFAELALVHHTQVVRVPDELPLDRAALLACGVITGFGAAVNRARVRPGESVVVIGAGGVGLNAVQGASACGANPIVAVDVSEEKLRLSLQFGATHAMLATASDLARLVRATTDGGADHVLVAVGSQTAARSAFDMLGPRGKLVIVGIPSSGTTMTLPIDRFTFDERTVTGTSMGSTRLSSDVPMLAELYLKGRLELDKLITNRYPLEAINEAMSDFAAGHSIRNVIVFDDANPS